MVEARPQRLTLSNTAIAHRSPLCWLARVASPRREKGTDSSDACRVGHAWCEVAQGWPSGDHCRRAHNLTGEAGRSSGGWRDALRAAARWCARYLYSGIQPNLYATATAGCGCMNPLLKSHELAVNPDSPRQDPDEQVMHIALAPPQASPPPRWSPDRVQVL